MSSIRLLAPLSIVLLLSSCSCGAELVTDGGAPDANIPDAATERDAQPQSDGGDSGTPDAQARDAGVGDASLADAGIPIAGDGPCMPNGFCWEYPSVFGISLNGIWGAAADDVWAVGFGGAIVHFDGSTWTVEASPVRETLNAISGTSASDIWIVGEAGSVLHREAGGWVVVDIGATQTLTSVQALASGQVWVSGIRELIRFDGSTWSPQTAVYGLSSSSHLLALDDTDIWLVSELICQHWNGSVWQPVTIDFTSFSASVTSIAQAGDDIYLYLSQERDPVFRFNRSEDRFDRVSIPDPEGGLILNGGIVAATAADDVWVSGYHGVIHFDGSTWTAVLDQPLGPVHHAWFNSGGGFFVGQSGMILERSGETLARTSGAPTRHASGHFGRSATDEWMLSRGQLLRRTLPPSETLPQWTPITIEALEVGHFAFYESELWVGTPQNGEASIVVYEGHEMLRREATSAAAQQWTNFTWANPNGQELIFGGAEGLAIRDAEGNYTRQAGPWTTGIDGSASEAWAVGHHGSIKRRGDDTEFVSIPFDASTDFQCVHYVSPNEVWIGGSRSTLLRWDGALRRITLPTLRWENGRADREVIAITGSITSPHGLWVAVTAGEVIELHEGAEPIVHSLHFGIRSAEFSTDNELVIVGGGQSIVRRRF